eukprot:1160593-Pelagomonas_calceolata.AAC.6
MTWFRLSRLRLRRPSLTRRDKAETHNSAPKGPGSKVHIEAAAHKALIETHKAKARLKLTTRLPRALAPRSTSRLQLTRP